jgi:hypothetical protein
VELDSNHPAVGGQHRADPMRPKQLDALYRTIRRIADQDRRYGDEPYEWDDTTPLPDAHDPEALWGQLTEADRAIRAARALKAHLEGLMLDDVTANGPIRLGDDVYYQGWNSTRKWMTPESSAGLLTWLAEDCATPQDLARLVGQCFRLDPGNLRITALRGIAGARATRDGWDPAEAGQTLEDTFTVRDDVAGGGPILTRHRTTLTSAPAWAKALEHGQRRPPRKGQKEDTTNV